MELRLSSLHNSAKDIINLDLLDLPVKDNVRIFIEDQLGVLKTKVISNFRKVIEDIYPEIKKSWWFSDDWMEQKYLRFYKNFDSGFDRWRNLYHHAQQLIENAKIVLMRPRVTASNPLRTDALRQQRIGMRQRDLLLNELTNSDKNDSEFYVFRYLASEGFLPGYNFTRLPMRIILE